MLYLSFSNWYNFFVFFLLIFNFFFFFFYIWFTQEVYFFIGLKLRIWVRGSSQGDCFSQDSCTGSQDLGECVSNSVAEAMIMEIKDMYHPAFRVFFWLCFFNATGGGERRGGEAAVTRLRQCAKYIKRKGPPGIFRCTLSIFDSGGLEGKTLYLDRSGLNFFRSSLTFFLLCITSCVIIQPLCHEFFIVAAFFFFFA